MRNLRDEEVGRFQLRAFDYRWALLRKESLKTNSFNVMLDLKEKSPGLVTTRQTKERFAAFAVTGFCGHKVTSSYDRSYVLPLFTKNDGSLISEEVTCLETEFLAFFREMLATARMSEVGDRELVLDVFNYILALLSAPSYVECFEERLKRDWPRVPKPGALSLFLELAELGRELADIQTMKSGRLNETITYFQGGHSPEVSDVFWSSDAVWLDKDKSRGFQDVPEKVWDFHIGGYQVCHKWLKDRKGRTLSDEDIAHYQKIIVAISETIRIMAEIDEVIDQHGGWREAFQTGALKRDGG